VDVYSLQRSEAMTKCFVLSAAFLGVLLGWCTTGHSQPLATPSPAPQSFAFALIGDLGYRPEHEPWLENVLTELNQTPLAFVVHVGDLGAPPFGSCTNEFWARRLAQFQASAHPVVFTPGDNEWTDCHDKERAPGYEPLERLARLRTVFFTGEQSLGQRTIPLTRQSQTPDPVLAKYRENVQWTYGGITFVTLHVVGSNNGLGRTPEGDAEYAERNTANLAWLRQGFAHARANQSRAIMIMQQANIFPELPPLPALLGTQPSGFTDIRALLEQETIAFGKPVVLVHGDSHFFRIDKPFGARLGRGVATPAVENFTRVETFGAPNHHWIHVTVDVDDPQVFTFRQRIVAPNIVKR
jgi:hypothetical protein